MLCFSQVLFSLISKPKVGHYIVYFFTADEDQLVQMPATAKLKFLPIQLFLK